MFDIETTGLDPYTSQVTLIGFKRDGKVTLMKLWEVKDEAKMILEALAILQSLREFEDTIVGYNNLKFDIPFMLERLRILGQMNPELWLIAHRKKWFDLYQFLGNSFRSMDMWLKKLEIKKEHPELDGRQMPIFYMSGEYEKIELHIIDDLNSSEELFWKLKAQFPDLIIAE